MKRHSGKQVHPSTSRTLQLQFMNKLSLPVFTGTKIEGEDCPFVTIALVDALTGEVVVSGPESSMKVEIVVLEGESEGDEEENWTSGDFKDNVVREREGKRSLLAGDVILNLKEGTGVVGELVFTDNSSWTRSRKFKLGAKVSDGYFDGMRVREAKTEAFTVKDHRGELYKKHYPPSLMDEVWRLEKIGKDGAFHKRLSCENINTVKDFLTLLCIDTQRLRNILGTGMSAKMWDMTVDHARTCTLNSQMYVYSANAQQRLGVIFNVVGQVMGLLMEQQYVPIKELSETQKTEAHKLVRVAFQHWEQVVSYENSSVTDTSLHFPPVSFPTDSSGVSSTHISGGFSFIQPSVSSPDIVSSMLSIGGIRSLDDYALQASGDLEFRTDLESHGFPSHNVYKDARELSQITNPLFFDVGSDGQTFCGEDQLRYFDDINPTFQSQNASSEPQDDLGAAVSGFLARSAAQSAANHCKAQAQTKWMMLRAVLKWSSIRRLVARRRIGREKCREIEKC
ncbi:calmodulin binding protein-like protein isoform X2 [Tasmannia lanceolata]